MSIPTLIIHENIEVNYQIREFSCHFLTSTTEVANIILKDISGNFDILIRTYYCELIEDIFTIKHLLLFNYIHKLAKKCLYSVIDTKHAKCF